MVDPREYRFGGPEVGRQDDRVADPLLGPQVGGDVGPAEPVDGLLRIPDQEQAAWRYRHVGPVGRAAGPAGGDADGQLDLDRVGVLELIQQQPPVLLVQGVPHGGAVPGVGEQVAGQDQQVVEFEFSFGAAHLSGFRGRFRDAPGQLAQRGIHGAGPYLAGRGDERGAFGLELVQAVGQPAGLAPVAPFEVRGFGQYRDPGFVAGGGLQPGPAGQAVEPGQEFVVTINAEAALAPSGGSASAHSPAVSAGGRAATGMVRTRDPSRSQLSLKARAMDRRSSSRMPAARASSSACSSPGSSSNAARSAVHRSSKATLEATSSSTSISGGRPASTGCSPRMRSAKECRVPIAAASRSSRAPAARLARAEPGSAPVSAASNAARSRSRSSAPAFSVKVTAATCRSGTAESGCSTTATTRSTSERVFPDPAPASTNRVRSSCPVICARAAASGGTRLMAPPGPDLVPSGQGSGPAWGRCAYGASHPAAR